MSRVDPKFTFMVYMLIGLKLDLIEKEEAKRWKLEIEKFKGTTCYSWLMCHVDNIISKNHTKEYLLQTLNYWEKQVYGK